MKHLYILLSVFIVSLLVIEPIQAQQEVMIRDLNTYDFPLESQSDIPNHPLIGVEVTFDAVVVAYPKNSGLATPDDGDSGAEPGRVHLFVTDVNAIDEGRDGMTMQIVVSGEQQRTLEGLGLGDVIEVTGALDNFNNTIQFNATDVVFLSNVEVEGSGYEDLAPLLEPTVVELSEINQPSESGDTHRWVAENYSKYAHRYLKFENLEVINSLVADNGRPWMLLSDGNTLIFTSDMSLRYRNDRGTYGFAMDDQDTTLSLDYNYRRPDSLGFEGPFTPPPPGSIVDISGFMLVNPSFDPVGFDESSAQSVTRIIPWSDGIRWTEDGNDPANRVTEGVPNDLEVLGYASTIDNFTITPDSGVTNADEVTISLDVLLPEEDYTLNDVEISFTSYPYTSDSGDTTTATMTASGNTYSYTFDSYDDFTTVDFVITATAETPDGVVTTATEEGSFYIESENQTAPVVFSPSAGNYDNQVTVELSSVTADAEIYYTTDGSDPTSASTLYTDPIELDTPDSTVVIKAIATHADMDDSPIAERSYTIDLVAVTVSTLAEIRSGVEGASYIYTGDAVVVFTQSYRNQKYIMDETGGILIDDNDGVITADYAVGDVVPELLGTTTVYNGITQFIPSVDPGASTETAEVEPREVTLEELDVDVHESMLVKINNVTFTGDGAFETGENYAITDASLADGETVTFRTNFYDADYIGTDLPNGPVNITAIVGEFSGDPQLTARSLGDIETSTSNELDDAPLTFALDQNYPNPFNPTTNIQYSVADFADVSLVIYDVLGRKIATLVNEVKAPGAYSVNFDASRLSSGTYFYRIEAGNFVSIKKMMLIK